MLAAPGDVRQDFFIQGFGGIIVMPFQGVRDPRFKYVKTPAQGGSPRSSTTSRPTRTS